MRPDAVNFVFWMLSFKSAFSLSSFIFIKRFFSFSLLSANRVASSTYPRLLIFLLAILIPLVLYPAQHFAWVKYKLHISYKLNKQGYNIQPWCTPFPILNQSIVPCLVLTIASLPAWRFLRRQVNWSGNPISLRIFHSLLWSTLSRL